MKIMQQSQAKRVKLLQAIPLTIATVLMLQGCSLLIKPPVILTSDLKQPCQELPELTGSTGQDVLLWGIEVSGMYHDCKAKHAATVEAINPP